MKTLLGVIFFTSLLIFLGLVIYTIVIAIICKKKKEKIKKLYLLLIGIVASFVLTIISGAIPYEVRTVVNKTYNSSTGSYSEKQTPFAIIESGVKNGEILGDSQNYANISGTSKYDNDIFLIDAESGMVHGMSKVEDGKFNISCNMQGAGQTKVYLTNDRGLKLYGNDSSKLQNRSP